MKSKKLIMLVAALVLTVAMATTTTFAWFTLNDVVTVNDFDFSIEANEGLLISLDGTNFKMNVDAGFTDKVLNALTPKLVEGAWLGTAYNFEDVKGTVAGAYDEGDATEEHPWWYQAISFRSDVAMDVTLTTVTIGGVNGTRKVYVPDAVEANTYGTNTAISANGTVNTEAKYAARIALFDKDGTLLAIYQLTENGTFSLVNGTTNLNFAAALYNMYGPQTDLTPDDLTEATTLIAPDDTALDAALAVGTTAREGANAGDPYLLKISAVMWLEGKDGNCTNACLDDTITIALTFKGTEAE